MDFSEDEKAIFFTVQKTVRLADKDMSKASVDVWNHKDEVLQCNQLDKLSGSRINLYESVVNIPDGTVYLLRDENDRGNIGIVYGSGVSQDYAKVVRYSGSSAFTRIDSIDVYLVNIRNGEKIGVKKGIRSGGSFPSFSPDGRFLIWYDPNEKAYFSFDIKRRVTTNISFTVPVHLFNEIFLMNLILLQGDLYVAIMVFFPGSKMTKLC